eukprot:4410098-Pleurochrysis_carterae.AAC.1
MLADLIAFGGVVCACDFYWGNGLPPIILPLVRRLFEAHSTQEEVIQHIITSYIADEALYWDERFTVAGRELCRNVENDVAQSRTSSGQRDKSDNVLVAEGLLFFSSFIDFSPTLKRRVQLIQHLHDAAMIYDRLGCAPFFDKSMFRSIGCCKDTFDTLKLRGKRTMSWLANQCVDDVHTLLNFHKSIIYFTWIQSSNLVRSTRITRWLRKNAY